MGAGGACAQEIERRKYETEEEKEALIPELRGVSRQEYLKKREEQKLAELKEALEDEERLFEVGGASLGSSIACLAHCMRKVGRRCPCTLQSPGLHSISGHRGTLWLGGLWRFRHLQSNRSC